MSPQAPRLPVPQSGPGFTVGQVPPLAMHCDMMIASMTFLLPSLFRSPQVCACAAPGTTARANAIAALASRGFQRFLITAFSSFALVEESRAIERTSGHHAAAHPGGRSQAGVGSVDHEASEVGRRQRRAAAVVEVDRERLARGD